MPRFARNSEGGSPANSITFSVGNLSQYAPSYVADVEERQERERQMGRVCMCACLCVYVWVFCSGF